LNNNVSQSYAKMASTATTSMEALAKATKAGFEGISKVGQSEMNNLKSIVTKAFASISNTFSSSFTNIKNVATNGMNSIVSATGNGLSRMLSAVTSGMNSVRQAFHSGTSNSVNTVRGFYNSFYAAGSYLGQGLRNGIASQSGSVISTARSLAMRAAAAVRSAMKIKSPSRVMMEIGGYFVEGFTNQVGKDTKYAVSASSKMSNAITDAFNPDMNYDVAGAMREANASVMSDIQVGGSVMMESKQSAHINVTVGGQEFETFSDNIYQNNNKRLNFRDSYDV